MKTATLSCSNDQHCRKELGKISKCSWSFDKSTSIEQFLKSSRTDLIHLSTITSMGTYAVVPRVHCHLCDKELRKSSLRNHINTVHSNIRRYECNICGMRTTSNHKLENHMKVRHLDAEPKHSCPACTYRSHSSEKVALHIKNMRTRLLGITPARFAARKHPTESKLRGTWPTCTRESASRQYKCTRCDASFARASSLKVHVEAGCAREEEGPQVCPMQCDYASVRSGGLRSHI